MALNYIAFYGSHIHGVFMGHSCRINELFCSSVLRWSKYIYIYLAYKTILSHQVFLTYFYLFDWGYELLGSGSAVENR